MRMVRQPAQRRANHTGNGRSRGGHWGPFLAAAIRSPRDVGTLIPSGPRLASRLAAVVPREPAQRAPVVVEVGAGDGAVTRAIVARAPAEALIIAVEKDAALADRLRVRLPGVQVVADDAATLPEILAAHGADGADVIVSVLPWTLFGEVRQRYLLGVLAAALRPDGVFTAAAYSLGYWTPAAKRFRGELDRAFGEVLPTRTVWRHVPPAMSYVCRHPAAGGFSADRSR